MRRAQLTARSFRGPALISLTHCGVKQRSPRRGGSPRLCCMGPPLQEALESAVQALVRIRAVESPPGDDGLRTVWHRSAHDADLVSYVDAQGHVVQQELTLLGDYFRWNSRHGLSTGVKTGVARAANGGGSEGSVHLDPSLSAERVLRAHQALQGYAGDDRYLRNISRILRMVATGLRPSHEVTVSRSGSEAPSPLAFVPAHRTRWLAVGLVALLALGGLVALWVRSRGG